MVDSNKILTVSYGTFSCTLEGFDDAFETMKAIAEYFRDLAADDRFFGAEPPTPDAEMLARIAERGSARRVEARASDEGIVLRSGQTQAAPALAAATAPAAAAPVAETRVAQAPVVETPVAETPVAPAVEESTADYDEETVEVEDIAEDLAEIETVAPAISDEDSIVAKLRRIRSVVSRTGAVAAAGEFAEDQETFEVSAGDGVDITALYDATVTPEATEDAALAALEEEISAAEDYEDVQAEAGFEEDDFEAEVEAFEDEDDFEPEVAAFDDEDDFEDEDEVEAFEDEDYGDDAEFEDDLEETAEAEGTFEDDLEDTSELYDDEDEDDHHASFPVAAVTAAAAATGWPRVVKVKRRQATPAAEVAPASELSAEDEAELQDELAALEAEIAAEAQETRVEAAYEDEFEDEDAAYGEEFAEDAAEADYAGDVSETEAVAWDEDDEDEEAWEEALSDDADEDIAEAGEDENFFEEDEIEDEAGEAIEAETENEEEAWAEDEVEEPVAAAPAAPAGRAKFDASASPGDMDRILAETNNQLHETEGTRRRSAIQHLRAAVAATKAEQQAGSDLGNAKDEDNTNVYREDLAQVVRPRRPRATGTPTRRAEEKPAPLRLVAEQRVDIEAEHRAPVRPRRVSIADLIRQESEDEDDAVRAEAAEAPGEGFPAFLEESGAEDLGQVLEAAASYLAFVEGREQFSRPQLMNRVREVDPDGYSREDALRAFGSLLREGKIRKVKGGRFAASDRIGFRPDQRAVG